MGILLIIGIILLVLWLLGFIFFKSIGALIHIALVVAVILIIIWLLKVFSAIELVPTGGGLIGDHPIVGK